MKKLFKRAHEMAKEIKREYPEVDYRAQFGICLSYLLNNKEEAEMTKEEWYEGLSEKEQSRIKDAADSSRGYVRSEETPEQWAARGKAELEKIIERKYNAYLKEVEHQKQLKEGREKAAKAEQEQKRRNLEKGIATIKLYESNRYRCWMAEVTGTDPKFGLAREFINPVEIKGNYKHYELKEGHYYNYLNDKKQHFVKVVNSEIIEMTNGEMAEAVQ